MPVRPPNLNQHLLVVRSESCSLYSCHSSRLIPAVLAALGAVSRGLFQITRVCSSNVNFPVTILDCYLASIFRRYPLESRTRQLCKAECDCAPCTRLVYPCAYILLKSLVRHTKNVSYIFEHLACAKTMSDLPVFLLGLVMRVVSRPTKIEWEEAYVGARSHRQAVSLENGHIIISEGFVRDSRTSAQLKKLKFCP